MAELKVEFTLSERDLTHLRRIMRKVSASAKLQAEPQIISAARGMAAEIRKFKPPVYVLERVAKLETMVAMLEDTAYRLPRPVRRRLVSALAYFANPEDLIPDPIPGLGFLDDAIMIELVARELRHELHAYQEFCRFRETAEQRPWTKVGRKALDQRLAGKLKALRAKVSERQAKDVRRGRSPRGLLRLW